jgi:hypothetical protein
MSARYLSTEPFDWLRNISESTRWGALGSLSIGIKYIKTYFMELYTWLHLFIWNTIFESVWLVYSEDVYKVLKSSKFSNFKIFFSLALLSAKLL